jgi:hypothetical protein
MPAFGGYTDDGVIDSDNLWLQCQDRYGPYVPCSPNSCPPSLGNCVNGVCEYRPVTQKYRNFCNESSQDRRVENRNINQSTCNEPVCKNMDLPTGSTCVPIDQREFNTSINTIDNKVIINITIDYVCNYKCRANTSCTGNTICRINNQARGTIQCVCPDNHYERWISR